MRHTHCPSHPPHSHPHHPDHRPHCHNCGSCPGGRIEIVGRLVLTVKYIDHYGHTQYFDIEKGKTYIIEAISQSKGRCTFTGRIIDFDSVKGIEKILTPPNVVDIGAIIVDYSTDYESKQVKIGIDNIVKISPIDDMDCISIPDSREDFIINDPFADKNLEDATTELECQFFNKNRGSL